MQLLKNFNIHLTVIISVHSQISDYQQISLILSNARAKVCAQTAHTHTHTFENINLRLSSSKIYSFSFKYKVPVQKKMMQQQPGIDRSITKKKQKTDKIYSFAFILYTKSLICNSILRYQIERNNKYFCGFVFT